jgi:hypothetical protein
MLLSKKWFWDKLDITHTTQDKQFAAWAVGKCGC